MPSLHRTQTSIQRRASSFFFIGQHSAEIRPGSPPNTAAAIIHRSGPRFCNVPKQDDACAISLSSAVDTKKADGNGEHLEAVFSLIASTGFDRRTEIAICNCVLYLGNCRLLTALSSAFLANTTTAHHTAHYVRFPSLAYWR